MSSGPTGLLFKQRNEHLETGRELPGITRWHAFSKDRTVLCATSFLPFLNLDQGKESRHRERERDSQFQSPLQATCTRPGERNPELTIGKTQ